MVVHGGDTIYPVKNYSSLANVIKYFIGSETNLVSSKHHRSYCSGFVQERSKEIIILLFFERIGFLV